MDRQPTTENSKMPSEATSAETAPGSNAYTRAPLGGLFVRTALPIIVVMGMNGLLAVVDALFLGVFVGPEALGAVTLMFPVYMLVVALSTLVSSGMSSILARDLGARRLDDAGAVFMAAHGLSLFISLILMVLFGMAGKDAALQVAGGSEVIGAMGYTYLGIIILFSPVSFLLALHSDALRNEGRVGLMAGLSLLVSTANIVFNYILIGLFELGVAGSAYGTVVAQVLALSIILMLRIRGKTQLRPSLRGWLAWRSDSPNAGWRAILAFGAPQSLSFLGLSLASFAVIVTLQLVQTEIYEATVSAYGIVTRITTFVFLPLLGLSHALQSITGNNFGARLWDRSDHSLRIGIGVALVYCASVELALVQFAPDLGRLFVKEVAVADEVARIMPVLAATFFIAGPVLMISTYFQAIGDAKRAALFSLTKTYLFVLPLTFLLPMFGGEPAIWLATPMADVLVLLLVIAVLSRAARRDRLRWGLFRDSAEVGG
jgi:putative MATE family efflux protein